jgi:signal transduction histidine kinase
VSSKQPVAVNMTKAPWMAMSGGVLAGLLVSAAVERRGARALAHERRRVAAGVHDLVMQDLSLALASARALAGGTDPHASLVVSAGERALAGARGIVSELTGESQREHEPIVRAIEGSAQAAARSSRLIFDAEGVPRRARADRHTREALVHVAREAVRNASKHARANAIEVTLLYTGRWRLTVRDEGEGFDGEAMGNGGFGLQSMRAHARALGGVLIVRSAAREGTTVEVELP